MPSVKSLFRRLCFVLIAGSCLAACSSMPKGGVEASASGGRADIATQPVLAAVTTRRPLNGAAKDPWFSAERASRLSIAQVRLVSPAQAGSLSLAAGLADWRIDNVEIVPTLSVGQPAPGGGARDVLIYVHGYNQTFASATLDAARLADGLSFDGDTVLFSWPSQSKLLQYIRDRESAIWSRDAFETMLNSLLSNPGIGRVHVVAHSMGSTLAVEGLRQAHARLGDRLSDKMGAIVFASPDIDIDGFSASMGRLQPLAPKMTVVTSTDDRAIALANTVSGGGRVGAAEKARLEALGLRVIDASGLGWGILNHDLFLTNAQVKDVIRRAIDEARQPNAVGSPPPVISAPLEASVQAE